MALELISPSVVSVVTLAEAKSHCRVDHSDDDAIINIYIKAAIAYLEGYAGKAGVTFGAAPWAQYHDAFPCAELKLLQRPVLSVGKVEYLDPITGLYVQWGAPNYTVDAVSFNGWVAPVDAWPTPKDAINAIKITYTAGHATTSDIPENLRLAVMMLTQTYYMQRETIGDATMSAIIPHAVDAFIGQYREYSI